MMEDDDLADGRREPSKNMAELGKALCGVTR